MAYCGPRGIPLSTFLCWDQGDQDAALAWAGHEAHRCPSCGFHPDEHPDRPHAHIDVCPGCVAVERTTQTDEAKSTRGAHVHLARDGASCARCARDAD